MVELELRKDDILRVSGPASISIINGSLRIVGATWPKGHKIVIPKTKSYVLIANEDTKLHVTLGEDAEMSKVDADEEPTIEWEKLAYEVAENPKENSTIIILGGIECGKTTLSTLIGNVALSKGLNVAIIDGDVGQSDIGPPTFISMGFLQKPILELREVKPEEMVFIGDTTPYLYTNQISYGIKYLVDKAKERGADIVIVDTDGWFKGIAALNYKIQILTAVKPNLVLVLSNDVVRELLKFEKVKFNIKQLKPPVHRRERSREDRRRLRERSYTEYFKSAKRVKVSIDDVIWVNTLMFKGRRLSNEELLNIKLEANIKQEILYGEILDNKIVLVLRGNITDNDRSNLMTTAKKLYGVDLCLIRVKGFEKGLIACIIGEKMKYLSPAIIEDIDFSKGLVTLYTPWQHEILGIQIGRVRLNVDENGRIVEVEKVKGDVI